jgi:hypothetical protein
VRRGHFGGSKVGSPGLGCKPSRQPLEAATELITQELPGVREVRARAQDLSLHAQCRKRAGTRVPGIELNEEACEEGRRGAHPE